jgi:hypothetical protein
VSAYVREHAVHKCTTERGAPMFRIRGVKNVPPFEGVSSHTNGRTTFGRTGKEIRESHTPRNLKAICADDSARGNRWATKYRHGTYVS